MRWLSNIYDPDRSDARGRVVRCFGETSWQAWQRQQEWLMGKIISEPLATPSYSMERLKAMNMVGVYSADGEE